MSRSIIRPAMAQAKQLSQRDGFTLVEVMVATVIAGIGIVAGFGMLAWAEQGRHIGARATQATALASSRLELLRVRPWDQLLTNNAQDGSVSRVVDGGGSLVTFSAEEDRDGIHLNWTVQLSDARGLARSSHAWIRVTASYRTIQGRTREVAVVALRGNPRFVGST